MATLSKAPVSQQHRPRVFLIIHTQTCVQRIQDSEQDSKCSEWIVYLEYIYIHKAESQPERERRRRFVMSCPTCHSDRLSRMWLCNKSSAALTLMNASQSSITPPLHVSDEGDEGSCDIYEVMFSFSVCKFKKLIR